MRELTTATETETGKPASEFSCTGTGSCYADPVMVVMEDGQFTGMAACEAHVAEVRRDATLANRVWVSDETIELNGRVFRREGGDRWRMDSEIPEWGVDVTFGADSVWEWQTLAAALDEIERLRSS